MMTGWLIVGAVIAIVIIAVVIFILTSAYLLLRELELADRRDES